MGRDRMFDTLRERGLLAPPPHRQWAQTTRRDLSLPVFRNEIEGLEVKRSNEAWVTDLTYVRTDAGFLYVSLITDKCSRKIVGYHADLMAPRSFGTHVRNRLKSEKQPNIGFFGQ
jgi:transposase InsO family protein